MPFTKVQGVGSGRILTANPLTGQPVTTDEMDVQSLETVSFAFLYTQGGGSTITAINYTLEASYDQGATWIPVALNKDSTAQPTLTIEPGVVTRVVSGDDTIALADVPIKDFERVRLSITTTGAAVSGDLLSIDALGFTNTVHALSGSQAGA